MRAAFHRGDMVAARQEQQWKLTASKTFSRFTSPASERAVYRWLCGVDMGPPRLPQAPIDPSQLPQLKAELDAIDFFEKAKLNPGHANL
jgi:dihydrodipicolinate synthase/N-acetylneuraminate lyase